MIQARPKRGLELFRPGTSRQRQRRRWVFLSCWLLIAAALVWPLFPLLARRAPTLFGLPPALTVITLALLAMLALQIWLFLGEESDPTDGEP